METSNKKKSTEEVYKMINRKYVQIKYKDKVRNNEIKEAVLEKFLKIMRTLPNNPYSAAFANMKPRLAGLGSYYDGLRVGHPSEYDMNVILKFHVNYKRIKLDSTDTTFDYTNIIMPPEFRRLATTPETAIKGFDKIQDWCDDKHRLSVPKFRSWMQGIVDAAMATLPDKKSYKAIEVKGKTHLLSAKISGPANTITIFIDGNKNNIIDVDLVPTFNFTTSKKIPIETKVDFEKIRETKLEEYFVVPKPNLSDFNWRLTFPFQERFVLKNKNNLKSVAKLMKLLRDVEDFKGLVSYFIKTLFMWETTIQKSNFWTTNSISFLFLHMLKRLREALDKEKIENFWCPSSNLITDKILPKTCKSWSNRLTVIIDDIEKNSKQNPEVILKYFKKKKSENLNGH